MGIRRQHAKGHNFILTLLSDTLNDEILMEHVRLLNIETTGAVNLKELADCRWLTSFDGLTVSGTTMCAKVENNKPGSLLAILVPPGNKALFGLARAYQMFAEKHRQIIRIFTDLHEALNWLGDDPSEAEALIEVVNHANRSG